MDEINIYNTIYQIYLNNLNFLEKKFPSIFEKIVILSEALDSGTHESRYELEFMSEKGCFNIFDKRHETYLYENSYEESDAITAKEDYTKNNAFSLLMLDATKEALSLNSFVKDLNPIKSIINQSIDFNHYEYLKIYKYLFMGSGLGIHIDSMVKKFMPNTILIVEPSIEIFRLSMFVTDYQSIADNTRIYLSIAEARNERNATTQMFFHYQPYLNYVIKYNLFDDAYKNILSDLYKKMIQDHSETFSYVAQLLGVERTIKRVSEDYKFLDLKAMREKNIYTDKPILILGAGPSAKKNIEWVRENHHKFYLVVVNTLLPLMIEENIKPDLLSVIDYNDVIEKFFQEENTKEFLQDTPIFMPTQVADCVINKLDKSHIYFLQTYTMYDDLSPAFMSSNVGGYLIQIMGILKANQIYCLGVDAAYDQQTGMLHSANSVHIRSENIEQVDNKIKAKGNFEEFVYTTDELLGYKNDFESVALLFQNDKNYNFYNLSDGVYIEGFKPLHISDIDLTQFKVFDKNDILKTIDSCAIYAKKKDFKEDLANLNEMKRSLQKHLKVKIKSRDNFIEEQLQVLLKLFDLSKKMSTPIFGIIFIQYLEVSGIYVYFYLNVRGKHIKDIQKLNNLNIKWTNSTIKMLEDMEECFIK